MSDLQLLGLVFVISLTLVLTWTVERLISTGGPK